MFSFHFYYIFLLSLVSFPSLKPLCPNTIPSDSSSPPQWRWWAGTCLRTGSWRCTRLWRRRCLRWWGADCGCFSCSTASSTSCRTRPRRNPRTPVIRSTAPSQNQRQKYESVYKVWFFSGALQDVKCKCDVTKKPHFYSSQSSEEKGQKNRLTEWSLSSWTEDPFCLMCSKLLIWVSNIFNLNLFYHLSK